MMPKKSAAKNNTNPFSEFVLFTNGGDGEIRTLEPLLTVTRFPIVRPRPARRHLRMSAVSSTVFNSIYQNVKFCNLFRKVFLKFRVNLLYCRQTKWYTVTKRYERCPKGRISAQRGEFTSPDEADVGSFLSNVKTFSFRQVRIA